VAFVIAVLLVACCVVTLSSGIALSVKMWEQPVPDIATATILYRIMCASVVGVMISFFSSSIIVTSKFIATLESVVNAAAKGGKLDELTDVVQRFRKARIAMYLAMPLGIGAWAIQAAFLPMFWFVILLHMFNVFNGCFMVWYGITSRNRREEVVTKMTMGRGSITMMNRIFTSQGSNNNDNKVKSGSQRDDKKNKGSSQQKSSSHQVHGVAARTADRQALGVEFRGTGSEDGTSNNTKRVMVDPLSSGSIALGGGESANEELSGATPTY